jgi:hypothetical protein
MENLNISEMERTYIDSALCELRIRKNKQRLVAIREKDKQLENMLLNQIMEIVQLNNKISRLQF